MHAFVHEFFFSGNVEFFVFSAGCEDDGLGLIFLFLRFDPEMISFFCYVDHAFCFECDVLVAFCMFLEFGGKFETC